MIIDADDDDRLLLVNDALDADEARDLWRQATGRNAAPALPAPRGFHLGHARASRAAGPSTLGLHLVVESGPDTGLLFRLPRGRSTIGRTDGTHVPRVALSSRTVSRTHAVVSVEASGARLEPVKGRVTLRGKRWLDDRVIDERDLFRVGDDTLRLLSSLPATPPSMDVDPLSFTAPGPPPPRAPWLALVGCLAPAVLGVVLWVVTDSWFMLLFGALGLITAGPSAVADLSVRRKALAAARRAALAQVERAGIGFPSPAGLLGSWCAEHPHRPPASPAASVREGLPEQRAWPARVGTVESGRIDLFLAHGERPRPGPLARSIPGLVRPRPGDLVAVTGPRQSEVLRAVLAWWVQSLRPGDELAVSDDAALPASLLLVPGVRRSPLPHGVVAELRPQAADREGSSRIALTRDPRTIAGPGTTWLVDTAGGVLDDGGRRLRLSPAGPSLQALDEAIRRRVCTPAQPSAAPAALDVHAAWGVELGLDGEPAARLNIATEGPHALIAGTTGSGKSELLRSWILGLCERHPATELNLVLFDFKGGSTFGPFSSLPHTQALVTDLEAEDAERVLDALGAEIRRREAWLAASRAADFDEASPSERPPRMLVAVDEFRVLKEEVPEAMDRLVRLATVGRSLGFHLILATQRPQGAISADILANVSLTICLRLASGAESHELLGTSAAATLDPAVPGSGWVRRGGGEAVRVRFGSAANGEPGDAVLVGPRLSDSRPVPRSRRRSDPLQARLRLLARGPRPPRAIVPASLPLSPVRVSAEGTAGAVGGLILGLRQSTASMSRPLVWRPDAHGGVALLAGAASEARAVGAAALGALARHPALASRSVVLDGLGLARDDFGWRETSSGTSTSPRDAGGVLLASASIEDPAWLDEVLAALSERDQGPPALLWLLGLGQILGEGASTGDLRREQALLGLLQSSRVIPAVLGGRELAGSRWLHHVNWRIHLPHGAGNEVTALWPRLLPVAPTLGRGVLVTPDGNERGERVQLLVPGDGRSPSAERLAGDASEHHHRLADGGTMPARRATPPPATAWTPPPLTVRVSDLPAGHLAIGGVDAHAVTWRPRGRAGLILGGRDSGRTNALAVCTAAWGEPAVPWRPPKPEPPREVWAVIDDADDLPRDAGYLVAERLRNGGRVLATALAAQRTPFALPWWNELDPLHDVVLMGGRTPAELLSCGWRGTPDPRAPRGRALIHPPGAEAPLRVQWGLM